MNGNANSKKHISDFDDLIMDWDYQNNPFLPSEISYGSSKVCNWICSKCEYKWQTAAYSRGSQRTGCPNCAKVNRGINKQKSSAQKNSFIEKFPEIAKEWHPYKNNAHNIKDVSAFSNIKVWWLCAECGNEWITSVNHRTKDGNACPKCSKIKSAENKVKFHSNVNNFAEKFPEIAKEWHPVKNGNLKANNVSVSSNKKVWWKCFFCGNEWQTTVNHRSSGENCPACNKYQTSFPEQAIFYYISLIYSDTVNRKKISGFELDIFIPSKKIAIEYDGKAYHNTSNSLKKDNCKDMFCKENGIKLYRFREIGLPDTNYAVRITCNDKDIDNGIIQLLKLVAKDKTVNVDSKRDRNKILENIRQVMTANSIAIQRPDLVLEWNYERNGNLNINSVAANANYKVWWKCSKCGYEWQSTPNHRFSGRSCPACARKICITGQNDLLSKNPKVAQEWNYEKNIGITPDRIAFKSNKKVWWICEKGHEWITAVSERNRESRSTNCPYCSNKKVLVGYNDLATTHPELLLQWNYEKNVDMIPENVTAGSHKKVWWKCQKGHEWQAQIESRKNGTGCPYCAKALLKYS